jgi:hypothetical protein
MFEQIHKAFVRLVLDALVIVQLNVALHSLLQSLIEPPCILVDFLLLIVPRFNILALFVTRFDYGQDARLMFKTRGGLYCGLGFVRLALLGELVRRVT